MKKFWEIFVNDDNKTIEILGESSNDTELTNNIVLLQKLGYGVRCTTPSIKASCEVIISEYEKMGYKEEKNQYEQYLKKIPVEDNEQPDVSKSEKKTYKDYSDTNQRIITPRHHIDAGFINRRKCFSVFGSNYSEVIKKYRHPGDDHLSRLMNDHLMISVALDFCNKLKIETLSEVLQNPVPNTLFCSTELVKGCGRKINDKRVQNKIKPFFNYPKEIVIEYHTEHIYSDTQRMHLEKGMKLTIIGEIFEINDERITIHPLVMGPPTFDHPLNKEIKYDLSWSGWEHYQLFPEDIDEFSNISNVLMREPNEWLEYMKNTSEDLIKNNFCNILGDLSAKDWGGEMYDHYSTSVHLNKQRKTASFIFKGPAKFLEMKPKHLGKNADQIYRLSQSNSDVLIVQHCHQVGEAVRETLRAFAVNPSRPRHYCIVDGKDTYKIFKAYGLVTA